MLKQILLLLIILIGSLSKAQTYGDYTLICPQNNTKAYLIDMSGSTYHTWTFSSSKRTGYSAYLMPGGILIRTVSNLGNVLGGGGITGAVQKMDWNGNVLWDFVYSSSGYCLHHDICPLDNGNVLMICYEIKSAPEVTAAGCSKSIKIQSEKIIKYKTKRGRFA